MASEGDAVAPTEPAPSNFEIEWQRHDGSLRESERTSLRSTSVLEAAYHGSLIQIDATREEAAVHKSTTSAAGMSLITVMVGAGALGFPSLFAKVGIPLGLVFLAIGGCSSALGCCLLTEAIELVYARTGTPLTKLEDVGAACFGVAGSIVVKTLINFSFMIRVSVYTVLMGKNLNYIVNWPYRAWVLAISALLLPMAFLRSMSFIEKFSFVGVLCVLAYLITMVGGSIQSFQDRKGDLPWGPEEAGGAGLAVSLGALAGMMFGFGPMDVVCTIRRDMEKPQEVPWSICGSHLVVTLMYAGVGIGGFVGFGKGVQGNISESMCNDPGCPSVIPEGTSPGGKWIWGYALAVAVVVNLLSTLPICLYCCFSAIEASFPADRPMPPTLNIAMRVGGVAVSVLVGLFVPFFLPAVTVVSSVVVVPNTFILPPALYLKAVRDAGQRSSIPFLIGSAVFVMIGLACGGVGIYEAIRDMLSEMKKDEKAGNPFKHFFH